ncbi:MAG: hypothetical protein JW927_17825 [Deltaproteobacteria bacterium]|nr:hypothetical protein [Deltaproteobacteria bacterium]
MSNKDIDNLDKAIFQSLSQEDQDFLARLDEEPNYVKQAMGMFKGSLGWINRMSYIILILLTIIAIYACIRFFNVSPDIAGMLKWGWISLICIVGAWVSKLWFAMHFQANRVLRAIKKLELQIASLKQNQ